MRKAERVRERQDRCPFKVGQNRVHFHLLGLVIIEPSKIFQMMGFGWWVVVTYVMGLKPGSSIQKLEKNAQRKIPAKFGYGIDLSLFNE